MNFQPLKMKKKVHIMIILTCLLSYLSQIYLLLLRFENKLKVFAFRQTLPKKPIAVVGLYIHSDAIAYENTDLTAHPIKVCILHKQTNKQVSKQINKQTKCLK